MQTIKTGIVVALLLAVCYGAFVALNAPEAEIPAELEQWANSAEMDEMMNIEMPDSGGAFSMDGSQAISGDEAISQFGSQAASGDPDSDTLPKFNINDKSLASSQSETRELPAFPEVDLPSPADSPSKRTTSQPAFPASSFGGERSAGGANRDAIDSERDEGDASSETPRLAGAKNAQQADGYSIPFSPESQPKLSGELVSRTSGSSAEQESLDLPLLDASGDTGPSSNGELGGAGSSASKGESDDEDQYPSQPYSAERSGRPTLPFSIARDQALDKAGRGELGEALELLSGYYRSPELGHAEHSDLVDILDALSREVIYSSRHLMTGAYRVRSGDSVASVAEEHQVAPELLAAINGLGDSKALVSGTEIKVIEGPFRAQVSLSEGELTLFVGEYYAGRFPVSFGTETPPVAGKYEVVDMRQDRTYYGPEGVVLKAGQPENPYGKHWISLGNNLCIHGSPEMARSDLEGAGCISLAPRDAADVYTILTKQSSVEITD